MKSVGFFSPVLLFSGKDKKENSAAKRLNFGHRLTNYAECVFAFGVSYKAERQDTLKSVDKAIQCRVEPFTTGQRITQVVTLVTFVVSTILASVFCPPALALLSIPVALFLIKVAHHQKNFVVKDINSNLLLTPPNPPEFEIVEESASPVASQGEEVKTEPEPQETLTLENPLPEPTKNDIQPSLVLAAPAEMATEESKELKIIDEKFLNRLNSVNKKFILQVGELKFCISCFNRNKSYGSLKELQNKQIGFAKIDQKLDRLLANLKMQEGAGSEIEQVMELKQAIQSGLALIENAKDVFFKNLTEEMQNELAIEMKSPLPDSLENLILLKGLSGRIIKNKEILFDFILDENELINPETKKALAHVFEQWDQRFENMAAYVEQNKESVRAIFQKTLGYFREIRKMNRTVDDPNIPFKVFQNASLLRFMNERFGDRIQLQELNIDLIGELEEIGKLMSQATPIGLQNPGNSCYMNSCVQLIMNIPFFRQKLNEAIERIAVEDAVDVPKSLDECNTPEKRRAYFNYIDSRRDAAIVEALAAISDEIKQQKNSSGLIWSRLAHLIFSKSSSHVSKNILNKLRSALNEANMLALGEYAQNDATEIMRRLLSIIDSKCELTKEIQYIDGESRFMTQKNEAAEMLPVEIILEDNRISFSKSIAQFFSVEPTDHTDTPVYVHDAQGGPHKFNFSNQTYKIKNPPPVVIIELKRFVKKFDSFGNQVQRKIEEPVVIDPDELIDLSAFCESKPSDAPVQAKYRLTGVNVHKGSMAGGHYYDLIRKGDTWFECNDSRITPVENVAAAIEQGYFFVLERVVE